MDPGANAGESGSDIDGAVSFMRRDEVAKVARKRDGLPAQAGLPTDCQQTKTEDKPQAKLQVRRLHTLTHLNGVRERSP